MQHADMHMHRLFRHLAYNICQQKECEHFRLKMWHLWWQQC